MGGDKICYICAAAIATYHLEHVPVCHKCLDIHFPDTKKTTKKEPETKEISLPTRLFIPDGAIGVEDDPLDIDLEWNFDNKTPTI